MRATSARWLSDRFSGDVGRASAVGGSGDANPWASTCSEGLRLLLDRLAEQGSERDLAALRFSLERTQGGMRGADGGPPKLRHDA